MADAKHPVRNSVVASLITATITGVLLALVPGGWSWVIKHSKDALFVVFAWLGSSIGVPAWLLVLLSLVFAIALVVGAILAIAVLRPSPAEDHVFTEAEFFGVKWRWKYGQHGIYDIASFCPTCDLQVHPRDGSGFRAIDSTIFRCDEGHWESELFDCTYDELEDRVRRTIQQRLRNDKKAYALMPSASSNAHHTCPSKKSPS